MIRGGLAALVLALLASPALAQACRSAPELEQRLAQATTTPFLAEIKPETPTPGWNIRAWGGFEVPAPGLGAVDFLRGGGEVLTTCGHSVTWQTHWGGRGVESAGQFKVTSETTAHVPRSSLKYSATAFRVIPDQASQTAWLTVTEGRTSWNYLVNFPATAIALAPGLHGDGPRLELIGLRANGVLTYAEFAAGEAH
jgi:hypothetical protein